MSPPRKTRKRGGDRIECCDGPILDGRAYHEEWCPSHIRGALTWVERDPAGREVVRRAETALNALVERVGLPVKSVTVSDVVPLARQLYNLDSIGCCMHALFTSPEATDETIRLCIHTALRKNHGHCQMFGNVMLRMTPGQRERVRREAKQKPRVIHHYGSQ